MKKLKKIEVLVALVNGTEGKAYVAQYGVCPPNQMVLYKEHPEIFQLLADDIRFLYPEIISLIIQEKNENLLPTLMKRCLSEENQLAFVRAWPEKVKEYLDTLENNLAKGRVAYLCEAAKDLYAQNRAENPNLEKIITLPRAKQTTYSPFAQLASML